MCIMSEQKVSPFYLRLKEKFPRFIQANEELGKAVREEGYLDEKTSHLIQIGAAAAIRAEGAVHSHVKRALKAGASREEIEYAIILLTSTIGFPAVGAALSWANDIFDDTD